MSTKRDYVRIAAAIRQILEKHRDNADVVQAMYDLSYQLSVIFMRDNPRFNDLRFMQACGTADQ